MVENNFHFHSLLLVMKKRYSNYALGCNQDSTRLSRCFYGSATLEENCFMEKAGNALELDVFNWKIERLVKSDWLESGKHGRIKKIGRKIDFRQLLKPNSFCASICRRSQKCVIQCCNLYNCIVFLNSVESI